MEVNKIKTKGVGESGAFYRSHPLINFIYFVVVIGVTMFSNHPVFLLLSFATAWLYSVLLNGKKAMFFNMLVLLPIIFITLLLNALTVRNGGTELFSLFDKTITLEAVIFGLVQGVMISSVVIWFSCFGTIVTEDKMIYIFGRTAPIIALTLSLILRFIPLLKRRFSEISDAQRCMGRKKGRTIPGRVRQLGKEIFVLITWTLEAAVESADSMEARGYGLKGRTSFNLFRFTRKEYGVLAFLAVFGVICIVACINGYTNIYYYPTILLTPITYLHIISAVAFCAVMYTAVIMDIRGMKR